MIHIHLVSDSTGDTVAAVARACLVQFEEIEAVEHVWSMIRSEARMERVISAIGRDSGLVLFTLVDTGLRNRLQEACRGLKLPCVPVLDGVMTALVSLVGSPSQVFPGRQHLMDEEYFRRIEAVEFALAHDDGLGGDTLQEADVILLGVSRTSKTPTCVYLANRGILAANLPLVPGVEVEERIFSFRKPLLVGLTKDPHQLAAIRRTRMGGLTHDPETDYVNPDQILEEIASARRLFSRYNIPVIDVSRRAIEETAAEIITLLGERKSGI
jgi:regulator of PEP synthase PpsR (kinase-PPPase family)